MIVKELKQIVYNEMLYLVFETLVSCSYKLILITRIQKLCDITKNQHS